METWKGLFNHQVFSCADPITSVLPEMYKNKNYFSKFVDKLINNSTISYCHTSSHSFKSGDSRSNLVHVHIEHYLSTCTESGYDAGSLKTVLMHVHRES